MIKPSTTTMDDIATALDNASVREARRISATIRPSRKWQTMVRDPRDSGLDGCPVFSNNVYTVTVRRYEQGWPIGGGPWAQLGIYREDGQPVADWRDMQRIKNDICGNEWEGIELFPAESRLLDPSNYRIMFCAPGIPIGMRDGRRICTSKNCIAPQRDWARGDEPEEAR